MEILTYENIIALLALTSLEIVLGIDNLVFLAILSGKLPPEQQSKARTIGLLLAIIFRVIMLLGLTWIMRLTTPLFSALGHAVSGRDLILILGGLFLVGKATTEIHHKVEGPSEEESLKQGRAHPAFLNILVQIVIFDLIFSLDSVITAVGMASHIAIMITAVVIAMAIMIIFATTVTEFINRHPTLKMLALSFLLLIGVMLLGEGFGKEIEKGYIYFAMAFSLAVELLNIRVRKVQG